jgi:hypothetical protein
VEFVVQVAPPSACPGEVDAGSSIRTCATQ